MHQHSFMVSLLQTTLVGRLLLYVDGDGLQDVLVGSPNYDPTSDANFNAGMVTLFPRTRFG